jgi:uroporphyrinogen decarboxylase
VSASMTSLERVLTALSHKEPDRVPCFLLATLHGARALGMTIKEYFADAANVAEGQLRLQARFGHDCLSGFFYGPIEIEAFGGEVIFADDGPPNSGEPFISDRATIRSLQPPVVEESPCLQRVLEAIELMRERSMQVPIIGVAMAPFSLPVMQLGFETYLDILLGDRALFERLMAVNEEFCVAWANAQLAAGATAMCYFDPLASPTILPPELYRETGLPVARRVVGQIKGPTATHMASGRCLAIMDDLVTIGSPIVGVSAEEDLAQLKRAAKGRVSLLGNLNGVTMPHWTDAEAERQVKEAIAKAGRGGGFLLADNHGEIPWQVSEDTLEAIAAAVQEWGRYPLDWVKDVEGQDTAS